MMVVLAGVDLAWQSSTNPTAIAIGRLDGNGLFLTRVCQQLVGKTAVIDALDAVEDLHGVAVDGPLLIPNESGQRECERQLSRQYASRRAGCHAANRTLYPGSDAVRLGDALSQRGFAHLGAGEQRWQIECYPHPALIELFGLPERLRYKKGSVAQRREGQAELARRLVGLRQSKRLPVHLPEDCLHFFDPSRIATLRGQALKHNEDALDAVVCLYIAALYQRGDGMRVFGDVEQGYIVVPKEAAMPDDSTADWLSHNQAAWDRDSQAGEAWSQPVAPEIVRRAREGRWQVVLTPNRAVPRDWFGELAGRRVLCLASGGGQQAPVLSAAGARVTVVDFSAEQLDKDRMVARRDGLQLTCIQADMRRLPMLDDAAFDLIFHPVSNVFVPDVVPVWRECFRLLRAGGRLLAGFMNPSYFLFDHDAVRSASDLRVRHRLPYSEPRDLTPAGRRAVSERAFEHSHSLEVQIGGQLQAGFVLHGLYEDDWSDEATPLNAFSPTSMATLAIKP